MERIFHLKGFFNNSCASWNFYFVNESETGVDCEYNISFWPCSPSKGFFNEEKSKGSVIESLSRLGPPIGLKKIQSHRENLSFYFIVFTSKKIWSNVKLKFTLIPQLQIITYLLFGKRFESVLGYSNEFVNLNRCLIIFFG